MVQALLYSGLHTKIEPSFNGASWAREESVFADVVASDILIKRERFGQLLEDHINLKGQLLAFARILLA